MILLKRVLQANCSSVVSAVRYAMDQNRKDDVIYVGVDPGTKFLGFAVGFPSRAGVYQIELKRHSDPVQRMCDVWDVLDWLNSDSRFLSAYTVKAIIEGASFGDQFRQVELESQRSAIAMWMHERGVDVSYRSPLTIRKLAFGSAKVKAVDEYPEFGKDKDAAVAWSIVVGLLTNP